MGDALDATPPCGACGGRLVEHHEPPEEGVDPECWWYCAHCGRDFGCFASPLTMRTAPWTAPVVAAVLAMLDERIAALNLIGSANAQLISARLDELKVFRQEVLRG